MSAVNAPRVVIREDQTANHPHVVAEPKHELVERPHLSVQSLLDRFVQTPHIHRRSRVVETQGLAAEPVTQSAMACLYVATKTWSAGGTRDYADLLDEAFDAVAAL
jgi:hypothetical protein